MDVHPHVRVAADDCSDRAGVVEVDVGHQDRVNRVEAEPLRGEAPLKRLQRRGRPRVHEYEAARSPDHTRRPHPRPAHEIEIDRLNHRLLRAGCNHRGSRGRTRAVPHARARPRGGAMHAAVRYFV